MGSVSNNNELGRTLNLDIYGELKDWFDERNKYRISDLRGNKTG
jgi:hypothetical protein